MIMSRIADQFSFLAVCECAIRQFYPMETVAGLESPTRPAAPQPSHAAQSMPRKSLIAGARSRTTLDPAENGGVLPGDRTHLARIAEEVKEMCAHFPAPGLAFE